MLLNVGKEVVFQHQGDSCQQYRINAWAFEDTIDTASLKVDLPRKFRYGHPAFVEDGFDKLSDMEVLRGHVVLSFGLLVRKKRGSCLARRSGYHALQFSQVFPRQKLAYENYFLNWSPKGTDVVIERQELASNR